MTTLAQDIAAANVAAGRKTDAPTVASLLRIIERLQTPEQD